MGKENPRVLTTEPGALLVTIVMPDPNELDLQIDPQPNFTREQAAHSLDILWKAKWGPCILRLEGCLTILSGLK